MSGTDAEMWRDALQEAETQLTAARGRVRATESVVRVFKERIRQGAPWPRTEVSHADAEVDAHAEP